MKRTIKNLAVILMLVVAFCLAAMQVSTADASSLTFAACEGGVMVSDCNESASGELAIPAEYNGSKVVKIGANAFDNCTALTSVTVPEGVTEIGESAFEGCTSLSDIDLPESLTTISSYAFFGCDSLKSVLLYPGATNIASYAFYDCAGLESIALPEGITSIAEGTFGECPKLTTLFIPNTVTSIETGAFYGCDSIEAVYYTASTIAWKAIDVGEDNGVLLNVMSIGTDKFNHSHSYTSDVTTQPTCTQAGKATFTCECGNIYKGSVDALGHKAVTIESVKATCTEAGTTAGEKCSVCGIVLTEPGVIPATGHKTVTDDAVEATCNTTGLTKGSHCDFCGEVFVKQEVIERLGHEFDYESLKTATTTENGERKGTCKLCGYEANEILYSVTVFSLSTSECTYNGKVRTPSVTVKDSSGYKLIEDRDYTVIYPDGRKNPGIYKIKVTLKGEYEGSKTLNFVIAPGKTSKVAATSSQKEYVKISWNKVTGATGYRVYIYKTVDGKTRKKVASVTETSYNLYKDYAGKALKIGSEYKVAVVAYTKLKDGTVIHALAGVAQTFTRIPGTPGLAVSSASGKAKLSWTNVDGETAYQVWYSTSKDGEYKKLATGLTSASYSKSFTKGKTIYFKVRAYTKVDGKVIYGNFSAVKSVKIK